VSSAELAVVALSIAALVLVVVELAAQRRYLLAWAVGLLAVAELIARLA
jgi:hypothetical protein